MPSGVFLNSLTTRRYAVLDCTSGHFAYAAAQLREAACCASKGDRASAEAYIDSASTLLREAKGGALLRGELESYDRPPGRGALSPWRTRKVLAFVDDNLSMKIRVDRVAALVGLYELV